MKKPEQLKTKRTQLDYRMAFKMLVIGEVERGELNQDQGGSMVFREILHLAMDQKTWYLRLEGTTHRVTQENTRTKIKVLEELLAREKEKVHVLNTAINIADEYRQYDSELIHHSDRGLQYCSKEYVEQLTEHGIKISMAQNGDPYENAIAERINGILKYEFLLLEGLKDHLQALRIITESIDIYNQERPHMSCHLLTPNQTHLQQKSNIKKSLKKTSKTLISEVEILPEVSQLNLSTFFRTSQSI